MQATATIRVVKQALLLLASVALLGCGDSTYTGTLALSFDGADLPVELAGGVAIDWDDEVNWTREVRCFVAGGWNEETTYRVEAYDRSVGGGIEFALHVQAFDGPDEYERDEFQPEPAVTVSFTEEEAAGAGGDDDDSGDDDDDDSAGADGDEEEEEAAATVWYLGTDAGGVCRIEVDDESTSGNFDCFSVPAAADRTFVTDAEIAGEWSCSGLSKDDDDEGGTDFDDDEWRDRLDR